MLKEVFLLVLGYSAFLLRVLRASALNGMLHENQKLRIEMLP
jgi:hypothetical protein